MLRALFAEFLQKNIKKLLTGALLFAKINFAVDEWQVLTAHGEISKWS